MDRLAPALDSLVQHLDEDVLAQLHGDEHTQVTMLAQSLL